MKKLILTFILTLSILCSFSQSYTTSLGFRIGGWENGLTVKHFLNDKAALEGIFSTRWRGFNVTGLYEVQNDISGVDNLFWYIGGGGHIGVFDDRYYNGFGTSTGRTYTAIGVDGILGVEYIFEEYPFNISFDWKPAINIAGAGNSLFWGDNFALSGRYIF